MLKLPDRTLVVDTETTGLFPYPMRSRARLGLAPDRPFMFQVGNLDGDVAIWRGRVDPKTRAVTYDGCRSELRWLKAQLADPTMRVVAHESLFERRMTTQSDLDFKWRCQIDDTKIMGRIANSDEPNYRLKWLAKKYTGIDDADEKALKKALAGARRQAKRRGWTIATKASHGKGHQNADYWLPELAALVEEYGGLDIVRTTLLYRMYRAVLDKNRKRKGRLWDVYGWERRLLTTCHQMERYGMTYLHQAGRDLKTVYRDYMTEHRQRVTALGHPDLNLQSAPQLQTLFIEQMGRVTEARTKKGAPKIDAEQLMHWARGSAAGADVDGDGPDGCKLSRHILEWKAGKKVNEYLDAYEYFRSRRPDGSSVLHPSWDPGGARTGRFSCIAKGTPIEILRDVSKRPMVAIEDVLPGDWAYTYGKDQQLGIHRVKRAWRVGRRETVVLHWQGTGHRHTGQLTLTPDHRVRKINGSWCRADRLKPGDRLMALHRGGHPRQRLWATGIGAVSEQRFVCQWFHGLGARSHHVDENPANNLPDNLQSLSDIDHAHMHPHSPERRVASSQNLKRQWRTGRMRKVRAIVCAGSRNANWRQDVTEETIDSALRRHDGWILAASREVGMDFTTFKNRVNLRHALRKEVRQSPHKVWVANHEVLSVTPGPAVDVYDLEIEGDHNFIAGEINVHNCHDPNLQQIASAETSRRHSLIRARQREAFGPRPGYLWYMPDYSQIEVWAFAFVAKEASMMKALLSGQDFHLSTAAAAWGHRKDFCTCGVDPYWRQKLPRELHKKTCLIKWWRQRAKMILFSRLYGGGIGKIAFLIRCSLAESAEFIEDFNENLPGVKSYMDELVQEVRESGRLVNLFGREYPIERDRAYKAVNYMIQGSCAEILKRALVRIQDHLRAEYRRSHLIGTVHDEIILEIAQSEHSVALMRQVVRLMQVDSAVIPNLTVPLPVGMKMTSTTWSASKEVVFLKAA